MEPTPPDIAAELARMLVEKGWTVRRLRDEGFGGASAEKLLGLRTDGLPSLESADKALRLLGRQLWHRRKR